MAGSHGYQFVFGSLIFYGFLAFILSIGDGEGYKYLSADINFEEPAIAEETGNWLYDWLAGGLTWTWNTASTLFTIFINPFSSIGFLAWLSIAILITNVYIIVTSLIP